MLVREIPCRSVKHSITNAVDDQSPFGGAGEKRISGTENARSLHLAIRKETSHHCRKAEGGQPPLPPFPSEQLLPSSRALGWLPSLRSHVAQFGKWPPFHPDHRTGLNLGCHLTAWGPKGLALLP